MEHIPSIHHQGKARGGESCTATVKDQPPLKRNSCEGQNPPLYKQKQSQNMASTSNDTARPSALRYIQYDPSRENEYLTAMRLLISKDLSEPYSIYVYRYFLYQWGDLCFLAMDQNDKLVGVVVSKLEPHRGGPLRGYIAMLAVREEYRGQGIATRLVRMAIDKMIERDADEVFIRSAWEAKGGTELMKNRLRLKRRL